MSVAQIARLHAHALFHVHVDLVVNLDVDVDGDGDVNGALLKQPTLKSSRPSQMLSFQRLDIYQRAIQFLGTP